MTAPPLAYPRALYLRAIEKCVPAVLEALYRDVYGVFLDVRTRGEPDGLRRTNEGQQAQRESIINDWAARSGLVTDGPDATGGLATFDLDSASPEDLADLVVSVLPYLNTDLEPASPMHPRLSVAVEGWATRYDLIGWWTDGEAGDRWVLQVVLRTMDRWSQQGFPGGDPERLGPRALRWKVSLETLDRGELDAVVDGDVDLPGSPPPFLPDPWFSDEEPASAWWARLKEDFEAHLRWLKAEYPARQQVDPRNKAHPFLHLEWLALQRAGKETKTQLKDRSHRSLSTVKLGIRKAQKRIGLRALR